MTVRSILSALVSVCLVTASAGGQDLETQLKNATSELSTPPESATAAAGQPANQVSSRSRAQRVTGFDSGITKAPQR